MSHDVQTKTRRSQDEWQRLMVEYEAGDLTQRAFCERHHLAYSTFGYWRKRLSGDALHTERATAFAPALLELPGLPLPEQPDWRLELELGQGVILRLR